MWEGADELLLTEHFDNKKKLSELKSGRRFLCHRGKDVTKIDKEIEQTEKSIIEFISGLGQQHLKSTIYMSLDMDVDVGFSDKL